MCICQGKIICLEQFDVSFSVGLRVTSRDGTVSKIITVHAVREMAVFGRFFF